MALRKRIALLCGQADEAYQASFIHGFSKAAAAEDLDVCVFSMFYKYQNTSAREAGDSNIFSLIKFEHFDGFVLLYDTMQTPGLVESLDERIHNEYSGPVLVVDAESRYFTSIWTDSYTPARKVIEHLIEVHGYRDIAYITGKSWHPHAIARRNAYEDALDAHGIKLREDRIFNGDFWYSSGESVAEELLRDLSQLPQAVACANDQMAIGLAKGLVAGGLRIPEDIAVAGFDCTEEGRTAPSPLTSAYIPARSTGEHAFRSLLAIMEGGGVKDPDTEVKLFIGGSCGCDACKARYRDILRDGWETEETEEGFYSLVNHMQEDMMLEDSLHDMLNVIYDNLNKIRGYDSFHLCLVDQWTTAASLTKGRLLSHGYSERMLHVLASCPGYGGGDRVSVRESFDTDKLLPELWEEHEHPAVYTFSPLYFEESCFGYAVVDYGVQYKSYDAAYRLYLAALMRGFESLRRAAIAKAEAGKNDAAGELPEEERILLNEVALILDENRLDYFYQPIVSAVDGSIYAFEALMRARSNMKISPLQIIKYATLLKRLADVEKATFLNVLGQIEENEEVFGDAHIFINSIPGTKLDQRDFLKIEQMLIKRGEKAVVELTEQAELDDKELSEMKSRFARMGIGTAVDDYGTGYSNVSNLLRYMPNYVKVDRSLLSGIQDSPQKQHFVREIVSFSHDNGIQVLAEGVETGDELRAVILLGCDLIQGYYTGRPSADVVRGIDEGIAEEIRSYQRERQEGGLHRVYETGKNNRISAATLSHEGYTEVLSRGGEAVTFRDYTISGALGQRAELRILIKDGYEGQITLEHVHLNSAKQLPLIELESGCKLTLVLCGDNILSGGGIYVPEGAELTVRGDGNINIQLYNSGYCGIGNAAGNAGSLKFYQDGSISVDANGRWGLGIGGKSAASIEIYAGRYMLQQSGDTALGIGCYDNDVEMNIIDCELDLTLAAEENCGIGSIGGSAKLDISRVFLHCFGKGERMVVAGSLDGEKAEVSYRNMGTNIDIRATQASGGGSLKGISTVLLDNVSYRFSANGAETYAYGSVSGEGGLIAINSNISIRIRNDSGRAAAWADDFMSYTDCRGDMTLNGVVYERF